MIFHIFDSLLYSTYLINTLVGTNLAIIFGSRIVVAQLKQSVLPYLLYTYRLHRGLQQGEGSLTRPEKELILREVQCARH